MQSWRRNLAISSFLAFCIFFGFALINPLLPLYTVVLGGGVFEVGVLLASFMLTRSFLSGPFGRLSDRIGRKRIVVTGMFLYALLAFLFTIPSHWAGLILVRVLQGLASAMVWPVAEALVIDTAPEETRTRALSIYMLVSQSGGVVGAFAGGGLFSLAYHGFGWSELTALRFPFYFTSAISFIGCIVGIFMLRDARHYSGPLIPKGKDGTHYDLSPKVRRSLSILNAQYFMEGFVGSSLGVVLFFFMQEHFGIEVTGYSILIGIASISALLVILPAGIRAERLNKKPFIFWGTVGSRFMTMVLPFSALLPLGFLLAYPLFIVKDVGLNAAAPPTKSLLVGIVPERIRGHIIGVVNTYLGIGFVVGSLASGFLWDMMAGQHLSVLGDSIDTNMFIITFVSLAGVAPSYLILRYVAEPKKGNEGA